MKDAAAAGNLQFRYISLLIASLKNKSLFMCMWTNNDTKECLQKKICIKFVKTNFIYKFPAFSLYLWY